MKRAANFEENIDCPNQEKCLLCQSGQANKCRKSNILYRFDCNDEKCKFKYFGESHRNGYCRGSEHLSDSKIQSVAGVENSQWR